MRSDRSVYLGVLAPLLLTIVVLVGLSIGGFQILSAVRAFVGGESLWSKARGSAVGHLRAYAASADDAEYRQFVEALGVIAGDGQARLALDREPPDLDAARTGFRQGENAPADIESMIWLYRTFRDVSFMREAIAVWADGDRRIAELRALGQQMRTSRAAGEPAAVASWLRDLAVLETRLVDIEKRFSSTLGRASRTTGSVLVGATGLLALLLAVGSAAFVRHSLREQLARRRLLIEANNRWDLAADADGVGVFDWDVATDRFHLDARARALYGIGDDDITDRVSLRARIHPDDRSLSRDTWDRAVATGGGFRCRLRVPLPDDGIRHLEVTGRMRDAERPSLARMIGVVRDVTLEVSNAELIVQKESAEQAARARMTFLSRLSHELRTPLNAILGMAQLLQIDRSEPLTGGQSKRVAILMDSGRHLLRLVDDVLDVTKIDSGALDVRCVPTTLQPVLAASLNLVETERSRYGIRIDNALPADAAAVKADPQRLQQVFVNLLSNGCKYNAPGGPLRIEYVDLGAEVGVSFVDHGAGLDAEQRLELFQPFKRLPTSAGVPGTGLGLVVVKLLLERMGGRIDVRSEPGTGSCFAVRLPKA